MASTREYCVYALDDTDDRGSVIDMPTHTAAEIGEPRKMNTYLTREELRVVEDVEPVWRRLRIGLLVTFCVIWVALLVSVIIIVVLSKKCPPRPDLKFWQSKVAYYVDPFAFKDSDGNWIGDLNGLQSELSYIRDSVGAGFVILTPIFQGHFTNNGRSLGQVTDFERIDPVLGTMSDFRNLLKTFRKQGLEVVISLDINGIAENHTWAENPDYLQRYDFNRNLRVRKLVDDSSNFHGRSRVLIVDSGDVGYGLGDTEDGSLIFLGSAEQPGGHLVFQRQFVINRGWKNNSIDSQLSTIIGYNSTSGSQKAALALPSATDVDWRHDDLLPTAAIFLLPGRFH
ncbi:hypothetical protein AHF37_00968 [Paragonimus kellicotti]|nr:hypothetical protein AHF37_00968 [Paragonimus kellicotti]